MQYDCTNIPEGYDRARDHGPEMLNLWMDHVVSQLGPHQPSVILDLGCGTGRFAPALAVRFRAAVVGVDPSERMLAQARRKCQTDGVRYVRGSGEAVPLFDGSVDMVFISMAFHHFQDSRAAARECRRVLRDGSPVLLRTGTRDRIASYPYVPYFPQSVPLMEVRLPTAATIEETFHAAGFCTEAYQLIVQTVAPSFAVYADKLAAGGDSILASLSSDEFNAGLAALRAHGVSVDPRAVTEPIDVFVFR
jgi:ubiquinone/menaquinone biosynthesis C-methylase UbiE